MEIEHIPNTGGVYGIINKETNDLYIGSTNNMKKRAIKHNCDLKHNKHNSKQLQDDWNNENYFEFEVIEELPQYVTSIAKKIEGILINDLNPKYNTYKNRSFDFNNDNVLLLQLDDDAYKWAIHNKQKLTEFISFNKNT